VAETTQRRGSLSTTNLRRGRTMTICGNARALADATTPMAQSRPMAGNRHNAGG